jgi:hypothetical protein
MLREEKGKVAFRLSVIKDQSDALSMVFDQIKIIAKSKSAFATWRHSDGFNRL